MHVGVFRFIVAPLVLMALVASGTAVAQSPAQPPAAASPSSPADSTGAVQKSEVETFYLLDKNGQLVPFFNMPFEEFEQVYKLYKKLTSPDEERRFVIQSMLIEGEVDNERSLATLQISLSILTRADGWVRVPLRLHDVVVRPPADWSKPDERFLEYDEADGFVCWLRGQADQVHQVRLNVVAKVQRQGTQSRLAFNAPVATSSQLKLRVPVWPVEVDPGDVSVLDSVRDLGDGTSELSVLGLSRTVDVSWQPAMVVSQEPAVPLRVRGEITARLVGENGVRCDAVLTVECPPGGLDRLVVRLPPRMQLVSSPQRDFTLRVIGTENDAQVVEVQLRERRTGRFTLQLNAEYHAPTPSLVEPVELGGFEVRGTPLQSGVYRLVAGEDWTLQWTEGTNVRRIESPPAEAGPTAQVAIQLAYDAQPCSLSASWTRTSRRVEVDPQFQLYVKADRVQLIARLKCRSRTTKAPSIRVSLPGWRVEEIVETDMVELRTMQLDEVEPLVVHLKPAAVAPYGQFDLTVKAERLLERAEREAGIVELPIPRVEAPGDPASVMVFADENVAVSMIADRTTNLAVESSLPPLVPGELKQPDLFLRVEDSSQPPRLTLQLAVRERQVNVAATAHIRFASRHVAIEQRMEYRVSYGSLSRLSLESPVPLTELHDLQVLIDGQPVWSNGSSPSQRSKEQSVIEVGLQRPRSGVFELVLRFSRPLMETRDQQVDVPLLLPVAEGNWTSALQRLDIETDSVWSVQLNKEQWQPEKVATNGIRSFTWLGSQWPRTVVMQVAESSDALHPMVIDQLWIQTWLSGHGRYERLVVGLSTAEPSLELVLPPGARVANVALNGRRTIDAVHQDGSRVWLELGDEAVESPQVVELWYAVEEPVEPSGAVQLVMPRPTSSAWIRRWYWQLIVPPEWHLLSAPSEMVAEMEWSLTGRGWTRRPALSQHELELRTGATHQPAPPAANQYLFGSVGAVHDVSILLVTRRSLLLAVSMGVFLIGLLFLYVPAMRRPFVLLAVAVLLGVAALWQPELSAQLAQAASLGLAAFFLSAVLRSVLWQPRAVGSVVRGTSRSALESTISETRLAAGDAGVVRSPSGSSLTIHITDPGSKR